ncbi:MAG TPA: hypothetical protein VF297_12245 [Pyrinomonadaceae bacterium]
MFTKSILTALFVFAVCSPCAAQARNDGTASLLVSYMEDGGNDVQHVERIDFVNGEVVSRKKVVTLNHETDGHTGDLVSNRYLVTAYRNKVFDLQEGRFMDGPWKRLAKVEQGTLPGLVSPDGTKSVYAGRDFAEGTDGLEIHFVGRPPVVVREEFRAMVRSISSFRPRLPLLWIDDERILTQKSNGNLVIVTTDGKVTPFQRLPCTSDDAPGLERNRSGKLVYSCGGENYFLDIERGKYEGIKDDLGNGFEQDIVERDSVYYYKGEEIGREGLDAVSTNSYLAMLHGEAKDGVIDSANIKTIKVWSAAKRSWMKLTVEGWGADIVGWIE